MSNRKQNQIEAALFFAAACLVMVVAANYHALLADLQLMSREKTGLAPGDGWRSVIVGLIVAAGAYGGFLVVLLPMYDFMVEVFDRLGSRKETEGNKPAPSERRSGAERRRRKSRRR